MRVEYIIVSIVLLVVVLLVVIGMLTGVLPDFLDFISKISEQPW